MPKVTTVTNPIIEPSAAHGFGMSARIEGVIANVSTPQSRDTHLVCFEPDEADEAALALIRGAMLVRSMRESQRLAQQPKLVIK